MQKLFSRIAAALVCALFALSTPLQAQDLVGGGASFPAPIYGKWIEEFGAKSGAKITYSGVGSGAGVKLFSEGKIDFGATDGPMTDEEISKAKGPVLHVPTVLGGVAVAYNVTGAKGSIKFSGDVLADIFLGKITKWNDARITALNAGEALPATDITVVYRSDASGTSYIFTDYLSAVSPSWAKGPGKGKSVTWPVGSGANGTDAVAAKIRSTEGAIGFVEMIYALQNTMRIGSVKNSAGTFTIPSIAAVTAAAASAPALAGSADFRASIVNAPGKDAYPISSLTWILVYKQQADAGKKKKLQDFLTWALTDGQGKASSLFYAPLPAAIAAAAKAKVAEIK